MKHHQQPKGIVIEKDGVFTPWKYRNKSRYLSSGEVEDSGRSLVAASTRTYETLEEAKQKLV